MTKEYRYPGNRTVKDIFIHLPYRNLFSLVIVLLLLRLCLPAEAFSYALETRVQKYTLKNGLKVLLLERHLSPTVSLYIRHRVGAVDEISGRTGTAHFLEHLMFKGTKSIGARDYRKEKKILVEVARVGNALDQERMKGPSADKEIISALTHQLEALQKKQKALILANEIDRLYTENGGTGLNASTGQDLTTYHVSLPANKIELWARIEADRMTNPVFREFYTERDVVMEERRERVESNPEGKLLEEFFAAAFHAHPYGRPILGWPSDMRFLNYNYTEEFFKRYHAPNNTVIAVVGDIVPAATLKIIRKYFERIPRQEMYASPITEEPPQTGERRVVSLSDANPRLIIGYHKPALPSFDDYVFDVIDYLLSRGRTSRLYKRLVEEEGIAESAQTANGMPGARYPNIFMIFAAPRHPHTNAELEKSIYAEIEKLKKEPVSEKEIKKIKIQLKADLIRGLDSNSELASTLSYYESIAGDFRYMTEHINVIEKIKPEDIMAAANKYLSPENRAVAALEKKTQ
ncbi:MAG: pitrilysin family protein [Syntrophales bacterium]|nr:pitrilysin family protein [Syntrophales bacterium]